MKTAGIIAVLAAVAAAAPSPGDPHLSNLSARDTDLCNKAANCEVYQTPQGTRLRFKSGMEPGSEKYQTMFAAAKVSGGPAKAKPGKHPRANDIKTQITLGKTTINYGTSLPSDVMKQNLARACPDSGACISNAPVSVKVPMGATTSTIELTANGQYATPQDRDSFVAGIAAALNKGVSTKQQESCTNIKRDDTAEEDGEEGKDELDKRIVAPPPPICHKITVNQQTNFVNINRFQGELLQGFMSVTVTKNEDGDKWCSILTGIIGVGLGLIGEEVGAVASGFFGVIAGAICGS